MTSTITRKPNRYAGVCDFCEKHVGAGEGYLVGKNSAHGRWLIAHNDCDANTAAVKAEIAKARANLAPSPVGLTTAYDEDVKEIVEHHANKGDLRLAAALASMLRKGGEQTDLAYEYATEAGVHHIVEDADFAYRALVAFREITTGLTAEENPEFVLEWVHEIGLPALGF